MIAGRSTSRIRLGAGRFRYRVLVQGEPCEKGSHAARVSLAALSELLSTQPSIWLCGNSMPEKITFEHVDGRWVVAAEAVVLEGDDS